MGRILWAFLVLAGISSLLWRALVARPVRVRLARVRPQSVGALWCVLVGSAMLALWAGAQGAAPGHLIPVVLWCAALLGVLPVVLTFAWLRAVRTPRRRRAAGRADDPRLPANE